MKRCGFTKYTDFSRKQIGVIFANAKQGNLKIEQWVMSKFYELADYNGYDDNRSVEFAEAKIKNILEEVFAKKYKNAQKLINDYTTYTFEKLSTKNQKEANRNFI